MPDKNRLTGVNGDQDVVSVARHQQLWLQSIDAERRRQSNRCHQMHGRAFELGASTTALDASTTALDASTAAFNASTAAFNARA